MKSRDGGGGRRRRRDQEPQEREFEQRVIDLARVTRVVAGGSACASVPVVAVGDLKGRVGVAMGKGADVASAVSKATTKARKIWLRCRCLKVRFRTKFVRSPAPHTIC